MNYDLYNISPGQEAHVTEILDSDMKQRFLDLGIVPGTRIRCVCQNRGGNMKAYLIRGAVIAIRKTDCSSVKITKEDIDLWD